MSFPDFPGCITAGKTLDEASRMAAEALALHIQGVIEDGDAVPDRRISTMSRRTQPSTALSPSW
jgi:predicted RNase H-like HicB family nuclease